MTDLCLDGDGENNTGGHGQETPRSSVQDEEDASHGKDWEKERVWEKRTRIRDGL